MLYTLSLPFSAITVIFILFTPSVSLILPVPIIFALSSLGVAVILTLVTSSSTSRVYSVFSLSKSNSYPSTFKLDK